MAALDVHPVRVGINPGRRLTQLIAGLVLYGASMAIQIEATLGLAPWNVLHEALAKVTGLSYGTVVAIASVGVLLCWVPLRQRPGIGTVANVLVISVSVDIALALLPTPGALAVRIAFLVGGLVLNGLATAAYIGVRLGPGPRDGLMTGISARTGWSARWVRTGIEVAVLAAGWVLGGTAGFGTALYALAIGPLAQAFLPHVTWQPRAETRIGH
ncbi:YczE/YyaS/YitT family protein [Actinokineospora sp. G85]|uniref:membrane protein YczE n=1 Tax=Actinokineospora sp. G85 TaxID=3406626 RepID=UPI003C761F9E